MTSGDSKEILSQIAAAITLRAKDLGIGIDETQNLANETLFSKDKTLATLVRDLAPKLEVGGPNQKMVLQLGSFTILLVTIVFDANSFDREYEEILLWAAMIRSNLKRNMEEDLHLVFVSSQIFEGDDFSLNKSASIEQDERFCRKFVFLPNVKNAMSIQISGFIDRTFLARPWRDEGELLEKELDAVIAFSSRTKHEYLSSHKIMNVIRTAGSGLSVGKELVSEIIEILDGKHNE